MKNLTSSNFIFVEIEIFYHLHDQASAHNNQKIALFKVLPYTIKKSARQVLAKKDYVRFDHTPTLLTCWHLVIIQLGK